MHDGVDLLPTGMYAWSPGLTRAAASAAVASRLS
jgi:hypothetical protein